MSDETELKLTDFYDRELSFTLRIDDDIMAPYHFKVEADPGGPGQSIQVTRRSMLRLWQFLEQKL